MRRFAAIVLAAAALSSCAEERNGYASIPDPEKRFEGPLRSDATIDMRDIAFAAQQLRLRAGGTVTWVNRDRVAHTVTAGSELYNELHSGDVEPGRRFSRSFREPGEVDYRCTIHANMEGTLRIER